MNDLNVLAEDLATLSVAYGNRIAANGPGHADNAYLNAQSLRFYVAQQAILDAISAAADRG